MYVPSPRTAAGTATASIPAERRRRWEALLPREEAVAMLQAGEWLELLRRLREARQQWPTDLELLRSVRVLEHYLTPRDAG